MTSPKNPKSPAKAPRARKPAAPPIDDAELIEEAEVEPAELIEAEGVEDADEAEAIDAEPVDDDLLTSRPPRPKAFAELEDDEEEEEGSGGSFALSRTDPLARYMQEVKRHPVLSREEEHELAVRYSQSGDLDAAYRLVASNLRLVVKIAYEYRRAAFNVLDLIQEGNVGLMHAVKKYDPFKGVKLSSYAAYWIRAYILRFVMDNWRMVKLGTTQAQRKLFFNLRKEQQRLAAEGFEAENRLLAERLGVTEKEVEDMDRRLSGDEFSIYTPVSDESGAATMGERLSLPAPSADVTLGNEELKDLLREELVKMRAELEGRELYIFDNRMMSEEPLTLQEIGDKYGLSRERARQIEAKLVKRLRERMQEKIPEFDALTLDGD